MCEGSALEAATRAAIEAHESIEILYRNATYNPLADCSKFLDQFELPQLRNTDWTKFIEHLPLDDIAELNEAPPEEDITQVARIIEDELQEAISVSQPTFLEAQSDELLSTVFSLQIAIERIENSSKSPIIKRCAIKILLWISEMTLIAFLTPIISPIVAGYYGKCIPKHEHKAQLKNAKAIIQQHEDTNIRIVKVNSVLNIRAKPNKKSFVLAKLSPLTTVKVMATKGKWALVCCPRPGNDEVVAGWVFKKYLSK